LIGVVCAKGMGSLRTFFIVRLLVPFGMFSSIDLGCLGLCLDKLLNCMLVGRLLVKLEVLLYGK
jgi:hypothetical protein